MKQPLFLLSLGILNATTSSWAQAPVKQEVEVSIKSNQMPGDATRLLADWLAHARRVRFYRETDGNQVSYEIKMKRKGRWYSVEFYEDGSLMDIEQLIRYQALPAHIRRVIDEYLTQSYDHHRARRVQKQYSAKAKHESDEAVLKALEQDNEKELTIRYELVVDVRRDSEVGSYELLFDDQGNFLQERKIVRRSLDYILY